MSGGLRHAGDAVKIAQAILEGYDPPYDDLVVLANEFLERQAEQEGEN